jgi:hypothetical protein
MPFISPANIRPSQVSGNHLNKIKMLVNLFFKNTEESKKNYEPKYDITFSYNGIVQLFIFSIV